MVYIWSTCGVLVMYIWCIFDVCICGVNVEYVVVNLVFMWCTCCEHGSVHVVYMWRTCGVGGEGS